MKSALAALLLLLLPAALAAAPPAAATAACVPPGTYDPVACASDAPDPACPAEGGRTGADLVVGRGSLGGATGVVLTGSRDCDGDQVVHARVLAPGALVDAGWTSSGADLLVQTRDGWTYAAWWGTLGSGGVLYVERGAGSWAESRETGLPAGPPAPPPAPWGAILP